jgi:protein kinase-like protein/zinc ribbon protein
VLPTPAAGNGRARNCAQGDVRIPILMFCTSCGAQASPNARFCPACGTAIGADGASTLDAAGASNELDTGATLSGEAPSYEGATIAPSGVARGAGQTPPLRKHSSAPSGTLPPRTPKSPYSSGGLSSSDPISGGRFAPGQIIAERYRVVALAGRGGMGEVYRAEDLRLGQVVAIKFLPHELSQDAAALARFHSEVRIARQVSHPNVCRVFDIGDVDGTAFLSMEYVDGEDLASVVRRIGRLSPERATEVARQICAGMAAAHEKGVIHRDLKPANVMLDGAGKIRIMDFGLAGIAAAIPGSEIRAGTPAYMAPEQLEGREVTIKSDIYSLGLIIYEILTGKRAFEAATLAELMKLREQGSITNPSLLVKDLDPLIERVTLRCLSKDPALRPASALQVAAALPGGDPLAAALAAGETPSPEMVAAAGNTEGMNPRLAMGLLATVVIALIVFMFAVDGTRVQNMTPMDKPPEVLASRAQEIIQQLGYSDVAGDSAYGFVPQVEYLIYIQDHDKTSNRWERLSRDRPSPMLFWYRQSPREMVATNFFGSDGAGEVNTSEPQTDLAGMMTVMLDLRGRLIMFKRVPPQHQEAPPSPTVPASAPAHTDWSPLFNAAGMQEASYVSAPPEWTPLLFADTRAAWTRPLKDPPDVTERIEAAAYQGKPVYFATLYPWDTPTRDQAYKETAHQRYAVLTLLTLFAGIMIASIVVVRRNRRLKRGDDVGAARLATFVLITVLAMWALRAHHVASSSEFTVLFIGLAWALLTSSLARVLYFALEPFVRRRDPHAIISWSRLIAGKVRDPLVGRDILIGAVYGVLLALFETCDNFVLPWLHKLRPMPGTPATDTLVGIRAAIGSIFHYTWIFVLYTLLIFFLLFLVRFVVKKDWLAAPVIVFLGAITNTGGDYFWSTFLASAVIWFSIYMMLRRFGLVALIVGLVVQNILAVFPITSHLGRWYASAGTMGMLVIVGVAFFGFYNALAGQSLFSDDGLDPAQA